ncbi:nuclear prelamin A recognition factor, putative [Ichthyophthirius multifiliis]|uniref:Nuclear prelamin A recognition factor, putative n=1 Tax=Ichthyophthirius multifiliis TaxID=5932 RepID=G0QMA7_ICHMU|nr:nuclear prelamin A recognition factor, putative [Ichthyophthirius multifiliis]EGR33647.1 nuclear prelamin A recognition factor, putative [Ichthyophthirius multifiliis]|eukprot:XP_004037633.1 nuclear prelamin A recognition factor, putative [Ichthyophthirius multifiliis]
MFSSTIKITNLDDYIAPSQDCILPFMDKNQKLQNIQDKQPIINKSQNQTAKITLSDCLACSGCVTTAESILQQQQSVDEFINKSQTFKHTVISISPQSRVSLAYHFGVDEFYIQKALTKFFLQNYNTKVSLPIITSECPGWTLYAEKAVGEFIIKHMSQIKSPQQLMGCLVKDLFAQKLGYNNQDILFVTIMPCYDKKVESARRDFEKNQFNELYINPNIETYLMHDEYIQQQQQQSQQNQDTDFLLKVLEYSNGSNDYLDYIIRRAAFDLFQLLPDQYQIQNKQGKNTDFNVKYIIFTYIILFQEIFIQYNGQKILNFARIYGLRNIQNITRNIKMNKCQFQYIEILACPSGCLNGGGQLKSLDENIKQKALIDKMCELLNKKKVVNKQNNLAVKYVYQDLLKDRYSIYFKIIFKHIEKLNTQSSLNW